MKKALNGFAVALLSVLSHGFGQLYLGRIKRGLLFAGISLLNYILQLFLPPLAFGINETSFKYVYWGMSFLMIGFALFVLFDALKIYMKTHEIKVSRFLPSNVALRFLALLAIAVLVSLGTGLILPTKSVYTYVVPSDSMSPTLEQGDHIAAVEIAGTLLSDMRGILVTYSFPPKDNESDYKIHLGRIAAVEGDKVRIDSQSGDFFVNGSALVLPNKGPKNYEELKNYFAPLESVDPFLVSLWKGDEVDVPLGHVFILRDNYSNAIDSRTEGPLDASRIGEKIAFIYYSKNDAGIQWKRINQDVK